METNTSPPQSPLVSSSSSSHTSTSLKKTSPLKHITPIIKKYDCQRQAKNGKSAKIKTQGKVPDEDSSATVSTPVQDLVAGMDSLDAALRRAEKCIAASKDQDTQADDSPDHALEPNGDDLGDMEEEGVASSTASSTQQNAVGNRSAHSRRNRVLKKRNQLQKDLDHALPLAAPDQSTISQERSSAFAAAFFQKVRDRFETQNSATFSAFLDLMSDLASTGSVTDLYHRILNLFEEHPDLCEEFLLCLMPKQAIQCDKFMEHLALTEMSSFLRKLELCFAKQPQHLRKIHASWARLAETPDITLETVRSTILPLLRGNTVLVDSFLELFPSEKPPESKMTDFDTILCDDIDSEHSGEEETFERVEISPEIDDPYGGENCQCCCHTSSDPVLSNRTEHCRGCGMKFISGKVFMQTQHGLRPVRIKFGGGTIGSNIKRLRAVNRKLTRSRSRRGRASTSQMGARSEDDKPTVETDDEATFSKVKSPRQRPKISKPVSEKVASSRSLSMGRTSCPRKPAGGKLGSPPLSMVSEQEALAAPGYSGDDKPADFTNSSNILQMDQDRRGREGFMSNNSNVCDVDQVEQTGLQSMELENNEIKEEDVDPCTSNIVSKENKDTEKERVEEADGVKIEEGSTPVKVSEPDATGGSLGASAANADSEMEEPKEDPEAGNWTRYEDRTILCTFQSQPDKEKVFEEINEKLPHRTVTEISNRFKTLMNLIQLLH